MGVWAWKECRIGSWNRGAKLCARLLWKEEYSTSTVATFSVSDFKRLESVKSGFCQHAVSSIHRNLALICFFFPYLKPPENPRNSPLLSQSLSIMRRGGGRGSGGWKFLQGQGWAGAQSPPGTQAGTGVAAPSRDPGACAPWLCVSPL